MSQWFNPPGRSLVGEFMDDPALSADRHEAALAGLARLNAVAGSARLVWPAVRDAVRVGPIRVLDVATGAGDVPIRLARRARRKGLAVSLTGCDVSPRAVDYARAAARAEDVGAEFLILDALRNPLPEGFDVVVCSLFLHHLSEADGAALLERMARAARRTILACDLERSGTGYFLAWSASRLFSTSDVVRTDAVLSARAAYTAPELKALADRAGLSSAVVERRWPCRLVLRWDRPLGP